MRHKVVFIDPRAKLNAYGKYYKFPVMGPLSLGTILQATGHFVRIFCESFRPVYSRLRRSLKAWFRQYLKEEEIEVVCISVMSATAVRSYQIADAIRKQFPKMKVVLGGPHVTFCPEEALAHADLVVTYEAEEVIVEVIAKAITGEKGIIAGAQVADLNTVPAPDLSLIAGYKDWLRGKTRWWKFWESFFPRVIPISCSRGCPENCFFCVVTRMCGRKLRMRKPAEIVEEMIQRIKAGLNPWFFFYDDNFGVNKKWTRDLLRLIIAKIVGTKDQELGIEEDPHCLHCREFKFAAQISVKLAREEEIVKLMSRAGCDYVLPGMESIFARSLKSYQKRQDARDIQLCIRVFCQYGIRVHGMFIVNPYTDTLQTIRKTIAFVVRHGIASLQFSALTPLPGARLFEKLQKQGRLLTQDWDLYDGTFFVYQPEKKTLVQAQYLYLWAWLKFYLNFGLLWREPWRWKYIFPALAGFLLWHRVHGWSFLRILLFGRSVS